MPDLWLGIIDLSNTKHIKNISQEKMPIARHLVGLVHAKHSEKINKSIFDSGKVV